MNRIATLTLFSTTFVFTACGSSTEAAANAPASGSPANASSAQPPAPVYSKAPETPAAKPPVPAANAPTNAPADPTADLGKLLSTITDGPTAQAAKAKLETVIQSLEGMKNAATSGQLGADLGKLAGAAASKVGVDLAGWKVAAEKQVTSLLANPAVKGAIGPTLDRLQALLK